jgi:hypothetical protein
MEGQIDAIEDLIEVVDMDWDRKNMRLDLDWAGIYDVKLARMPQARRRDPGHRIIDNPFIGNTSSRHICLGTATPMYQDCWARKDYFQCVKIIITILTCKQDRAGHRKWKDCG